MTPPDISELMVVDAADQDPITDPCVPFGTRDHECVGVMCPGCMAEQGRP